MAAVTTMATMRTMPCKQVRVTRTLFQNQRVRCSIPLILGNTKVSIATELSRDVLSCCGKESHATNYRRGDEKNDFFHRFNWY